MTFTPEQIRERADWFAHACTRWERSQSCAGKAGDGPCAYCIAAAMLRAGADALAREQARDVNVEASLASMQEAVENMKAIVEGKA